MVAWAAGDGAREWASAPNSRNASASRSWNSLTRQPDTAYTGCNMTPVDHYILNKSNNQHNLRLEFDPTSVIIVLVLLGKVFGMRLFNFA